MTKKEFFNGLDISLGFLTVSDKNQIKAFYEKELENLPDETDITDIVRSIDLPSSITDSIKNSNKENEEKKDLLEDDLIFSKPLTKEKSPEIIHSMENKEVKTLYGEKVILSKEVSPSSEILLEPMDEANGFTSEEIQEAKVQTLEKTEKFREPEEELVVENKASILIEEEEEVLDVSSLYEKEDSDREPGYFEKVLSKMNIKGGAQTFSIILLSLIVAPFLLTALILSLGVYLFLFTAVLTVSIFLVLLTAAFVCLGILELIYGILSLFQSVPVALIELGLGTILFSLVTFFAGFIYQFVFGIVPAFMKKVNHLFAHGVHQVWVKLYGGKA